MAVVRRLVPGTEGVKIGLVGFFAHAVQAGFPRQGFPVFQGCVVVLHLLGLPMGFLALVSEVVMLGCMAVALRLLGPVVLEGVTNRWEYMALGCMAVALRLLGLVPRAREGLTNRWERA